MKVKTLIHPLLQGALILACIAVFALSLLYINARLFVTGRPYVSQRAFCVQCLREIEIAKEHWAERHKNSGFEKTADLPVFAEAYLKTHPPCPGGGVYDFGTLNTRASCSLASSGHSLSNEPQPPHPTAF
jgi:hypothetical protein